MSLIHNGWVCCDDGELYINVKAITVVRCTSTGTWIFGPGLPEEGCKFTGMKATDLENGLNEGWETDD